MGDLKVYLDELANAHHITSGAILEKGGGHPICTAGFEMSAEEIKQLADGFEKPDLFTAKGVHIHGKKYIFLGKSPDGNCIRTKLDKGGAILVRTGKHFIVGIFDEKIGAGNCTKFVEATGDKMKKAGL